MDRVNSTQIVSRFFDSSAHSLPITFYNRSTPPTNPSSPHPDTPYYPGAIPISKTESTISWQTITTNEYRFDSTLSKTRVKAVWSPDISNWHYPKVFHPGFEYAIWGRYSDGPWYLYGKVPDKPNQEGKIEYTFSVDSAPSKIIVMVHNPNYPPTPDILSNKPDCWHFLVGEYPAV